MDLIPGSFIKEVPDEMQYESILFCPPFEQAYMKLLKKL